MTKGCLVRAAFAIIIAVFCGIVIEHFLIKEGDNSAVRPILSEVDWRSYNSQKSHISFNYPMGWIVIEEGLVDQESGNLMICPSSTELPKEIRSDLYCIIFYPKERLLHPRKGFYDETELFTELRENMKPYDYDYAGAADYRFIRFNYLLNSKSDFTIGLLGLYRQHKDDMVGLSQILCTKSRIDECVLIFKRVLDSVKI